MLDVLTHLNSLQEAILSKVSVNIAKCINCVNVTKGNTQVGHFCRLDNIWQENSIYCKKMDKMKVSG